MIQKYFNRFELKFQISLRRRDRIIEQLSPFMKLDPHVENNYDYDVRSVYFDSPFRDSYFEKENGVKNRVKLRIRYYPNSQNGEEETVFIELKRKMNNNVSKSRIITPFNLAYKIVDNRNIEAKKFYDSANKQDKKTLNEIWYLYKRYNLRPVSVVLYNRQPYMTKKKNRLRITFDTSVRTRNFNFDLHNGIGTKYIVPKNICIMEVKYNSFIPLWAARIMTTNNCLLEKVSKFASGLEKTKVFSII